MKRVLVLMFTVVLLISMVPIASAFGPVADVNVQVESIEFYGFPKEAEIGSSGTGTVKTVVSYDFAAKAQGLIGSTSAYGYADSYNWTSVGGVPVDFTPVSYSEYDYDSGLFPKAKVADAGQLVVVIPVSWTANAVGEMVISTFTDSVGNAGASWNFLCWGKDAWDYDYASLFARWIIRVWKGMRWTHAQEDKFLTHWAGTEPGLMEQYVGIGIGNTGTTGQRDTIVTSGKPVEQFASAACGDVETIAYWDEQKGWNVFAVYDKGQSEGVPLELWPLRDYRDGAGEPSYGNWADENGWGQVWINPNWAASQGVPMALAMGDSDPMMMLLAASYPVDLPDYQNFAD